MAVLQRAIMAFRMIKIRQKLLKTNFILKNETFYGYFLFDILKIFNKKVKNL